MNLEVRQIGPPTKNPGCANNRGSPLYASGNSSYQILRFPNAPAAMIFKSKTAYGDDADALSYRLTFKFLRFQMRADTLLRHKKDHIGKAIAQVAAERKAEDRLTGELVLSQLRLHGFYDPGKFFDEHGVLKDINDMDPDSRAVIRSIDFVNLYEGEGEQKHCFGQLRKIRTSDQIAALKLLGQHFGLFPTAPIFVQQNNIQNNLYLRTEEELQYFVENGEWPNDTNPRQIGPASPSDGSGGPGTQKD